MRQIRDRWISMCSRRVIVKSVTALNVEGDGVKCE